VLLTDDDKNKAIETIKGYCSDNGICKKYQVVLQHRFVNRKGYQEIAKSTGYSVKTIWRICRGHKERLIEYFK